MYALQVAMVKGLGGIATAVAHYERMFRLVGVRSAMVFRGPSAPAFRAAGFDVIDPPFLLSRPWAAGLPLPDGLRQAVRARAGNDQVVVIVHSDLALSRLVRLFPEAVFVAPCHSDKTKHKGDAQIVLTLNHAQHLQVETALPSVRVREFGNPFVPDPATVKPIAAAPSGRAPRLNFVGRFESFKDPMTLIDAFAIANLPDGVELRVIGGGRLAQELHDAAARSPRRIEFSGWRPQPFAEFDSGDVLVLPSLWESYSYVIREALNLGVPVIASDIEVHRDALADGAFGELFPRGDARALASTLEKAIANVPLLRDKATKGGDALRARFGAEPFWRALSAEIESVLERRTAPLSPAGPLMI